MKPPVRLVVALAVAVLAVVLVTVALTQATQAPPCRAIVFEANGTPIATTGPLPLAGQSHC